MAGEKDRIAEDLRDAILDGCELIRETERADLLLVALSFQSKAMPERHVWIDTDVGDKGESYSIDLEDWTYEGSWDNAVATVETKSESLARDIARSWLCGDPLEVVVERCTEATVTRR